MREVLFNYGECQIQRDKSPDGIPRWIVTWKDGSMQTYNAAWYHLKVVRQFVEAKLQNDSI